MSVKTVIISLLLIGLGALMSYGWFRFVAVFEPAFKPQYAESTSSAQHLPRLPPDFGSDWLADGVGAQH